MVALLTGGWWATRPRPAQMQPAVGKGDHVELGACPGAKALPWQPQVHTLWKRCGGGHPPCVHVASTGPSCVLIAGASASSQRVSLQTPAAARHPAALRLTTGQVVDLQRGSYSCRNAACPGNVPASIQDGNTWRGCSKIPRIKYPASHCHHFGRPGQCHPTNRFGDRGQRECGSCVRRQIAITSVLRLLLTDLASVVMHTARLQSSFTSCREKTSQQ